jgi:hypothetical protein
MQSDDQHDRNVVLAAYYCRRTDPQRRYRWAESFACIEPWYTSLTRLQVRGIIFHDGLSAAFVARYQSPLIRFVYASLFARSVWSGSDSRFLVYRRYLAEHSHDYVLMTDISDVTFLRDPFPYMRDDVVFVGAESGTAGDSRWARRRFPLAYASYPFWDRRLLNCGILGGSRATCLEVLGHIRAQYWRIACTRPTGFLRAMRIALDGRSAPPLDMAVVNFVLHRYFAARVWTDALLHSPYKSYNRDNRDVCIAHK